MKNIVIVILFLFFSTALSLGINPEGIWKASGSSKIGDQSGEYIFQGNRFEYFFNINGLSPVRSFGGTYEINNKGIDFSIEYFSMHELGKIKLIPGKTNNDFPWIWDCDTITPTYYRIEKTHIDHVSFRPYEESNSQIVAPNNSVSVIGFGVYYRESLKPTDVPTTNPDWPIFSGYLGTYNLPEILKDGYVADHNIPQEVTKKNSIHQTYFNFLLDAWFHVNTYPGHLNNN